MSDTQSRLAEVNGRLWGSRARDWAELQEPQSRPVYETVMARAGVGDGTRYLDVGCATGVATAVASARGASVTGVDPAEALLEIARERVPAGRFHAADCEALPLPDDSFDVVTGFNSIQYAARPEVALAELRRVARPGGRIVLLAWGDPDGMEAHAVASAIATLQPPMPAETPKPLMLSDETVLRDFVAGAGLPAEAVFDIDTYFVYAGLATALRGWMSTGIAARAIENAGEQAVAEAFAGALARFRQADGSFRFRASFRCLVARA